MLAKELQTEKGYHNRNLLSLFVFHLVSKLELRSKRYQGGG
jgi:hypothetical protein